MLNPSTNINFYFLDHFEQNERINELIILSINIYYLKDRRLMSLVFLNLTYQELLSFKRWLIELSI